MTASSNRDRAREHIAQVIGLERYGELIDEALELTRPAPEKRAACRAKIIERTEIIPGMMQWRGRVSAGKIQKILRSLEAALQRVEKESDALKRAGFSRLVFEGDRDEFMATVGRKKLLARLNGDGMVIPKGKPKRDPVKIEAARSAFKLLEEFSHTEPSSTAEGPYFRLTAILYEAATGETDAGLERSCRTVLTLRGEWSDDLYGPPLIIGE